MLDRIMLKFIFTLYEKRYLVEKWKSNIATQNNNKKISSQIVYFDLNIYKLYKLKLGVTCTRGE